MNILLIAPSLPDINAIPEIRLITAAHRVHVLNGTVTAQDIHEAVTSSEYDVIHFATHIRNLPASLDSIVLSGNESLDLNSATRFAKLAKAKLVFFNICLAARFATYMVQNGVPCVVYTTITIDDHTAWELPCAFYEECKRAEKDGVMLDFRTIFDQVNSGDGIYGVLHSQDYYVSLLQIALSPIQASITQLKVDSDALLSDIANLAKRTDYLDQRVDGYNTRHYPAWLTLMIVFIVGLMMTGNIIVIVNALGG